MLVMLDVDGTLVDSNYLHVDAWARALHELGLVVPRALIHRQIGKGTDQFLPMFVKDARRRKRAQKLHLEFYEEVREYSFPLPGAHRLFAALRKAGHSMWLATSGSPKEIQQRLLDLEVGEETFDGIVSAGDVKRSKPYPDIFKAVLEQAGARAKDAVVVGDTLWDVQAARRARVRVIALMTGGAFSGDELQEAGAEAVFADCEELRRRGLARLGLAKR